MLREYLNLAGLMAAVLLAMAVSQQCTAHADERGPTDAERHERARAWSAQQACARGETPVWINATTVECLVERP